MFLSLITHMPWRWILSGSKTPFILFSDTWVVPFVPKEEAMLPVVHEVESHPEQLWSHCWEQNYCPRRESNPCRPFLSQPLFWATQAPLFITVIIVDVILAQTLATNKARVTEKHSTFFGLSVIWMLSWSKQSFHKLVSDCGGYGLEYFLCDRDNF